MVLADRDVPGRGVVLLIACPPADARRVDKLAMPGHMVTSVDGPSRPLDVRAWSLPAVPGAYARVESKRVGRGADQAVKGSLRTLSALPR